MMTRFVFPVAVGAFVLGGWLALALIEDCLMATGDPKFDCWTSLQLTAVFAAIGAVLAMIAAVLVLAVLHRFLPSGSIGAQVISAALSSIVLVLLFYSVINWDVDVGGMAGLFFGWLFSSFVVCGLSLIAVHRVTGKTR